MAFDGKPLWEADKYERFCVLFKATVKHDSSIQEMNVSDFCSRNSLIKNRILAERYDASVHISFMLVNNGSSLSASSHKNICYVLPTSYKSQT